MGKSLNVDIVVIGAGLTGLTLAYYLRKAGKKVVVVEKENRCGGAIRTFREEGFLFESGPNTGVLSSPELVMLFDDLKEKCEPELANPQAKQRWILKNGKWQALPSGPVSAISTNLFTWKDKFRILGEPFRKPGSDPMESVADLVIRRMGRSYLNYAVDPFIAGIYAGDPNQLVTKFAMPKLYNLEHNYGSFIRGAIKKSKEPKTAIEKRATKEVFSVKGGLQNLTDALADSINSENILLNCSTITVEVKAGGFQTLVLQPGTETVIDSEKVISTVGGYALPSIFPFLEKELAPVASLEYARVAQVVVGYNKWSGIPINAFGGLVPSLEKRKILGILFPSSIFPNRAPEGGALLSVFIGGMRNPEIYDLDDDSLKEVALQEIADTLHPSAQHPDLIRLFRYPHAIPQYGKASGEKLERIAELEKRYPGLILAGNIRDGIGMSDRTKQGRTIADQLG